jgi:hypothetical protein
MIILSNGWKLPETGDLGSVWFPALEDNINLSNTHNHNDVNSERIEAINLLGSTLTVLAASFADQGDGYWRSTVTVPNGESTDNYVVVVKDPTTKEPIGVKLEKLSSTQFYIYTNTVQDFELYFGV